MLSGNIHIKIRENILALQEYECKLKSCRAIISSFDLCITEFNDVLLPTYSSNNNQKQIKVKTFVHDKM